MLTLHSADALLPAAGQPVRERGAVLVNGGRIEAVGDHRELAAAHPGARTRSWPGLLLPGLVHRRAAVVLETAYHPDPREAAELGEAPLTGPALAALRLDATRWGASARRGLQRMLRHGTTAVVGPFHRPTVRTAVQRSGLLLLGEGSGGAPAPAPEAGPPSLDPLAEGPPERVLAGTLTPGARADLAVLLRPDPAGPYRCVATVLAGRLVHRAR